jgi:hypothetical protein
MPEDKLRGADEGGEAEGELMASKIKKQSPHYRVSVASGETLQVYLRDAHGGRTLMTLPGPLKCSVVHVKPKSK